MVYAQEAKSGQIEIQFELAMHLDEVFVKVNGVRHYMWRAVDHEGEVVESYVTKRRDQKAALKFLRKSLRRYGS